MRFVYHTRGSASVVVILLTSLSLVGQTRPPAASDEANEVPNTGAITGRVINENGQPLPNATVFIRAFGSTEQGRSLITDQEGNFQSSGLDRVAYLVSASVPGYAVPPRDLDSPQVPVYRVGDSVTLVMAKGGVITGSVTTSAGEPVVGVRVQAQMIRDGNGQPSRYGATIKDRATDDRGVYRIYGLLSGTYVVMAGAGGNPWGPGVSAYDTDAPTYAPSSSRATAAEITVRTGEESSNVDIRYRGEPGHVISGTANGSQTAEPSVFLITLSSTQDGGSQWSTSSYQPIGSRGFVFFGVADGEYDVTAQSFFPTGERMLSKPKRITVKGADVSGIELITQPLGLISGRVVLEDSKAVECKDKRRPVFTETQVSAWHNEKDKAQDQPQFIWSLGAPSIPDAQGNITLRNLAPGQYRFVARFFAKYWYLESIALPAGATPVARSTPVMRNADIAGNWITLKQGERVTGLIVRLAAGGASLRGKITMVERDQLPPRLFVYLVPTEPEKAQDILRFFAAPVSPDGSITLNNLAPGRYWMVAQKALEGALPTLTKLRMPDETETRAKLRRDAEAAKIEIEFKPCQNVTDYLLPLKSPATAP